jgi:hypothetical protein
MSNIPGGVALSVVKDPVLDFSSKPSYLVHANSTDSVFLNVLPIQNYSSSLISFKINLSNALSQVTDKVIVCTTPVQLNITGSRVGAVGTPNLLADNEWGVRSNAFLKCIQVGTVQMGTGSSYSIVSDSGIVISALESSAPELVPMRQLANIDNVMVDNVADYNDVLYTNRSTLGLYSSNSGADIGRCAYDIKVLTNTPTSASLLINFKWAIFVSPLLQTLHVNSNSPGISHVDSMTMNFALTNLSTRLLSFAKFTNNGNLTITNITPLFGSAFPVPTPFVEFQTYNIISQYFNLPQQVNMPLPVIERFSVLASCAYGQTATIQLPTVSLNSVPSYCLLFGTYTESAYTSQSIPFGQDFLHATQLTDAFVGVNSINAQVNSVNQQNNSSKVSLWKSYVRNGGVKPYAEWSALPLIKTLNAPNGVVQYLYPSGGPVKLNFGSDLVVKSPSGSTLSPSTNFKFNCSFTVNYTNTLPYSNGQLVFYVVYVHPQVMVASGVNNTQIISSVLSIEDNISVQGQAPTGHYASLNTHDLLGYGKMGMMHKLMEQPKMAHKIRKHRMHVKHLKDVIGGALPEMSALAMHGAPQMFPESRITGHGSSGGGSTGGRRRSRKTAMKF